MSWPATTGSTPGPSLSSVLCATAASPAPTTWPCTWRGTRTENRGSAVPMHFSLTFCSSLGKVLNYKLNYIYKKRKKQKTGNVYFVYLRKQGIHCINTKVFGPFKESGMLAVMYMAQLKQISSHDRQPHLRVGWGVGVQSVFAVFLPKHHHLKWQCLVNKSVGRHRKKAGLYVKILLDIGIVFLFFFFQY